MQALGHYLIIKLETQPQPKEGELAMPDLPGQGDKPGRGTILSLGAATFASDPYPPTVEERARLAGRKVAFRKYHAEELEKLPDGNLVVVEDSDVVALLD